MLEALRVIVLLTASLIIYHSYASASNSCNLLSSQYFQWIKSDGSLVIPSSYGVGAENETQESCCGQNCTEAWMPLSQSQNCQWCWNSSGLICHGSDVYAVPSVSSLPSTNISLFKMSGVGLIALPPNSFTGLTIQKLVIENSNLTYIASDAFAGVISIKNIRLRNNTLDYLTQDSFKGLKDLKTLDLTSNGLRVLSSLKSADLQNLQYFSLAGNPIYTLDVFFLKNSGLRFLDLKNVTFNVKLVDLEKSGFSSMPETLDTLDFSRATISVKAISKIMTLLNDKNITTLNLGFLNESDSLLLATQPVRNTLKYLTFEGTNLNCVFPPTTKVKKALIAKPFVNLRELNMKNCNINSLGTGEVFEAFPNLQHLTLSDNWFYNLDLSFFSYFPSLSYMDLSSNFISEVCNTLSSSSNQTTAQNLQVVDLSCVTFAMDYEDSKTMFAYFPNVKNLSLCGAFMNYTTINAIQYLSQLEVLDVSDTLPNSPSVLSALNEYFTSGNSSLTNLHFTRNNFVFPTYYSTIFSSQKSLKSLDLSDNLIRNLSPNMFGTNLQHVNLSQNLITTWYTSTISNGSQLSCIDLSNNQITFVSQAMVQDFYKLEYLNLNTNPLICNTKIVTSVCEIIKNKTHNLTMMNYQYYQCYDVDISKYRSFTSTEECDEYTEEVSTTETIEPSDTNSDNSPFAKFGLTWIWTYVIVGVIALFTVIGSIVYVKWWSIRCFVHRYLSLRKARLLRKNGESLMRSDIQYDVFVSYSDVDRTWVLDHLIPNMESDGDISLCFHERDFQVGMSILENIIECMDRSNSLLLIVSSAFVRSKWCQFEMHLAQYRLIETIRDQLVLVLLEDIPRRSRPQTLHHLMMTKTYLIWPQQPCKGDANELFWKRLKRALKPNHIFPI